MNFIVPGMNKTIGTSMLNKGQQEAADGFFAFLFSKEKEMIMSGPAGTGKTYTMGDMIDRIMPEYFKTCKMMSIEPEFDEVVMCATTNKAAEVLSKASNRPTVTIHSFLALRVMDDYSTGRSKIVRTAGWKVHTRKIIFVDESSMIDFELLELLREGTAGCKIVFVGDHCQLAPVMEDKSPIYKAKLSFYELKESVRNAGQPALMQVCAQLRETVETGIFKPIQIVPGVIDLANDEEMQDAIAHVFQNQTREARILCYTNARVQAYNDHIRDVRNLPSEYGVGELLVNSQAIQMGRKQPMLSVETEVEIMSQDGSIEKLPIGKHEGEPIELDIRRTELKSGLGEIYRNVALPVDREHFVSLSKWYAKRKNWERLFYLKNTCPDLRPRDAATIHKAQGSSHDIVFIDMSDISNCHQPQTVARLLYVAFSRARERIILYGQLTPKYGGLIE